MHTVMPVYGSQAEAVALAPVVRALERSPLFQPAVVMTGRGGHLLRRLDPAFGATAHAELGIPSRSHSLHDLTVRIRAGLRPLFDAHRPAVVLVQGGTPSGLAVARAAYERSIPVVHLDAGVTNADATESVHEHANRRVIGQIARLSLAPTEAAKRTLLSSGVPETRIAVTGSPVIDAVQLVLERPPRFDDTALVRGLDADRPLIVVAVHREENQGEPLSRIGTAVRVLAARFPEHLFVVTVPRDQAVREQLAATLGAAPNVVVTGPVAFPELVHLIDRATLVLTDSGGVQEASALDVPVMVLAERADHPEATLSGTCRLVGTHVETIVDEAALLLTDPTRHAAMARAASPFGDGRAAERTLAALAALLGVDEHRRDSVVTR